MHKRVHFDATTARFPCEICGKQLRTQYILKTHMEIHNVKKLTYTCDLCNKNFASAASLHRHMRTHTGIIEFISIHLGYFLYSCIFLFVQVNDRLCALFVVKA